MWSGFQAKKLNTRREIELELAVNWAESENQAELVPGPDPDQKIKSASMPDHHVKGQPAAAMYVREKGRLTFDTHRETPCRMYTYLQTWYDIVFQFILVL